MTAAAILADEYADKALDDGERRLLQAVAGGEMQVTGAVQTRLGQLEQRVRTYPERLAAVERMQSEVCCLADVEPVALEWLWPGRISLGKLTIIEGHPGTGKSHLTIDIAARLSTGRALPGGAARHPCNVLLVGVEDGLADTVRPRLDAAGADVRRVYALRGFQDDAGEFIRPLSLPDDVWLLEAKAVEHNIKVLVLDPLNAFLGGEVDNHKDHHVRRALSPLVEMADRNGVTVVCVRHLTKSLSAKAITAGGGSIGIIGLARSALLVSEDPDDPELRVVAQAKNNLARLAPSLTFRIESAPQGSRIAWEGESIHTADSLIAAGREDQGEKPGTQERAGALLRDWLSQGPLPNKQLETMARAESITMRTLQRAAKSLGVTYERTGFGKDTHTVWSLPGTHSRQHAIYGAPVASGGRSSPQALIGSRNVQSRQASGVTATEPDLSRVAGASLPEVPTF